MGIRMSGLASGLDTEALVKDLVSSYQVKTNKYKKAQTKLEWKQDAWKDLNKKIYSLYTDTLFSLKFSKAYNSKKTSVSDETKASVVAANSAVSGTQTLSVQQLAKAGYLTGGVVKRSDGSADAVTSDTKLSDLGVANGSQITIAKGDGTSTTITLNADTTVQEFVGSLQNAGVGASFDETNQRFFVNSTKTGEKENFTLTAGTAGGLAALQNLGLYTNSKTEMDEYNKLANYTSTEIADIKNTYAQSLEDGKADRITASIKEKTDDIIEKYTNYKSIVDVGTSEIDALQDEIDNLEKQKLNDTVTPDDITKINDSIKKIQDSIKEKQDALNEAVTNLPTYESMVEKDADGKLVLNTSVAAQVEVDATTEITNQIVNEKDQYNKEFDNRVQFAKDVTNGTISLGASTGIKIDGQDSKIMLNGADYTSGTNSFNINGLTITAKAETVTKDAAGNITGDTPITLSTDTDVDEIYDTIKNFIKEYNSLIKEMDTKYNASAAKGYEPLTDEEKEAMSDSEIEKWETKIKDSLLRRDDTLSSTINIMKSAMQRSFEIDGKKYNLTSFGIKTQAYFSAGENEKGMYHIAGDKEDSIFKEEDDILKTMIASDPDTVMSFFSQLTAGLYNDLGKKMTTSSVSSAFTVYNDKQMKTEYDDYTKKIKKWEDYVSKQEEYWYNKFTAMETALSKLQSSTSALAGLLGG